MIAIDYSYAQMVLDLSIGALIGVLVMAWLQRHTEDPFDIEYDHAFGRDARTVAPQATLSEWFTWAGGRCPVEPGTVVNVRFRGGHESISMHRADAWHWDHLFYPNDIVAYQVVA